MFALAATAPSEAGQRYALVVGVNECPQFRLTGGVRPRPLRGAEADADAVAGALERQFGFPAPNIELLKGSQATYAGVKAALARLQEKARRGDCVVVHFSGHGTQIPDRAPLDETTDHLDEALCLADATDTGQNLLVDDELGILLDDLEADLVTVILDCCHAGTGTKDPNDDVVARYLPFPGVRYTQETKPAWREISVTSKGLFSRRTAFLACRADEEAYERRLPELGMSTRVGQFTQYLLLGLAEDAADADADGVTTNQDLIAFARARLDKSFNRSRQPDLRQQPVLESDDADAPVFVGR